MRTRLTLIAVVALGAALGAQSPSPATTIKPDNYYAAGNRIEVLRPMDGDVVVAAREIDIAQTVAGDILAAGWRVNLSAPAADDVRMVGGEVGLNAPILGDVTIAGGTVTVGTKTHVTGRSWISGGSVTINGIFDRDLKIAGQSVSIGGEVRQPLHIVAEKVEFLPTARILSSLTYKSPQEATVAQGAAIAGPINYEKIKRQEVDDARAFPLVSSVLFFVHLLIAGLLVVVFVPRYTDAVIARLRSQPGWSLLAGFVLLVTVPIAALLLIVSILALPLGLALSAGYVTALFLAVLATAFFVGDVEARLFKAGPLTTRYQHALWLFAGVLTLTVLRSIPWLGGWVVFFSILFGLGALSLQVVGKKLDAAVVS